MKMCDAESWNAAQQLAPSRVSSAPGIQFNLTEGLTAGPQYVFMMVCIFVN